MNILDSDAEVLRAAPLSPPSLARDQIQAAALLADGPQRIEDICRVGFRKINANHYAVLDPESLAAEQASDLHHLASIRQKKIRDAGERHVLDEQNTTVLPWTWSARFSCLLLRLVGAASVFVVWNTVSSLVISSGEIDRFVEYPILAFAFSFGTFAVAVGIDAAIGTLSERSRKTLFICSMLGAVAAFAYWLNEVGGLVTSANMTLEQLKQAVLSPQDHTFTKRLLISQVATEMMAGLLAWMSASRILEKHRVVGPTDNAQFNLLEGEEKILDEKIKVSGRRLKEIETKREQLVEAEGQYVLGEVGRLLALKEEARICVRKREEEECAKDYILHHGNNGNGANHHERAR